MASLQELWDLLKELRREKLIDYIRDGNEVKIILPEEQKKMNGEFVKSVIDLYHEILPELPKVYKITQMRKSHILQRAKENKEFRELDAWKHLFEMVKKSRFLLGDNNRGWRANLDWIIRPTNFVKILEGFYTYNLTDNNYAVLNNVLNEVNKALKEGYKE